MVAYGFSLRNPGTISYPGVMYGRWFTEEWDGNQRDEKPLFYQGIEKVSEGVLLGIPGKVHAIRKKLEELAVFCGSGVQELKLVGHGISFRNPVAVIHPGVMYG